jgi:hypothetical protein
MDASKKNCVAAGTLMFDCELFIGGLFQKKGYQWRENLFAQDRISSYTFQACGQ